LYECFERLLDGILVMRMAEADCEGLYANPQAGNLLGYGFGSLAGTRCSERPLFAAHGKGCSGPACPLKRARDYGSWGKHPHILFMRDARNRAVPLSLTFSPLPDGSVAVSMREVTEEYRQLRIAGELQKRMVTAKGFQHGPYLVDTLYKPLEFSGGDYIESFSLGPELLVSCVADATGHGISASLFSVIFKTLFHASLGETYSPAEMLRIINKQFCETITIDGYYLTALIAVIEAATGKGLYASAAHPEAMVLRREGRGARCASRLGSRNHMIGMVEDADYDELPFEMLEGDSLVMATDGLMEAVDADGIPFGHDGVEGFFSILGPDADLELLYAELVDRARPSELADDVSLIRIRRVAP